MIPWLVASASVIGIYGLYLLLIYANAENSGVCYDNGPGAGWIAGIAAVIIASGFACKAALVTSWPWWVKTLLSAAQAVCLTAAVAFVWFLVSFDACFTF